MIAYHKPVLLSESVGGLDIKPNGVYVDATFGGGGHSREILSKLDGGRLFGIDQDEDVLANIPDDDRFTFIRHNFRFLSRFLDYYGIESIDGILADLGVSSHHFDEPERGFSFRFDSSIDMRMNQKAKVSAIDVLANYPEQELSKMFWEFGELKNARRIAKSIVEFRGHKPINQTTHLRDALSGLLPKHNDHQFLAKIYQALRIEVNSEIAFLKDFLEQAGARLKKGGRMVVISYHSLEDRLVKTYLRDGTFVKDNSIDLYGNSKKVFKLINKKVIVPTEEEIAENNRARSAKLRIAEKL